MHRNVFSYLQWRTWVYSVKTSVMKFTLRSSFVLTLKSWKLDYTRFHLLWWWNMNVFIACCYRYIFHSHWWLHMGKQGRSEHVEWDERSCPGYAMHCNIVREKKWFGDGLSCGWAKSLHLLECWKGIALGDKEHHSAQLTTICVNCSYFMNTCIF